MGIIIYDEEREDYALFYSAQRSDKNSNSKNIGKFIIKNYCASKQV